MRQISGHDAVLAVLNDPGFVVPPVPPGSAGIAWLRATVGRFSTGEAYERRRALSVAILDAIPPESLRTGGHPVAVLAHAMGADESVVPLVRDVAQAYQPGTGDEARADVAVERLVAVFGGRRDEPTAARIGVLVQACEATSALIERARHRPVAEVLRDDPPVPATKRQALRTTTVGGITVEAGEVVRVCLAGDLAFGAGPRRCPGRTHALALAKSFAALHRAGAPLILPNVWDIASARALVRAGFSALGTTSLGVAAANGLPDGAGAADAETLLLTRRLAKLPVALTVDIETGSVAAAVAVAAAGAVGVNMEDAMGSAEAHAALIRSVKQEVPGLFVNARTDTHWQQPGDLAETVRRVRLYADAGADGVFVPGLSDPAGIAAVVAAVDLPVNILFQPGRHTVATLADLGVRRISTGSLLFRAALAASVETATAVRDGRPIRPDLPSYAQVVDY
jgi:2-methylisocitrate lyase-like PEP mutase family enzyme